MPSRTGVRAARQDSREVAELKRLRIDQPELATAADLQLELLALHRRVQARVPLPWIDLNPAWLKEQQAAGRPVLRFADIPLNWTDFRLMFRETTELLRRFEALDLEDYRRAKELGREGKAVEPMLLAWYEAAARRDRHRPAETDEAGGMMGQIFQIAARPFLARCAEGILPRLDLSAWTEGYCPLCGGEPEFAVITQTAERLLICSRCTGRWRFAPLDCPFCGNADRTRITSFASRDGLYRIYACDHCRRYLKAYDGRSSTRPVLVPVDTVATLPLDAAAMQKGYVA
ncbi:MAG: formate dehydrogenase accessory protein FdhE [Acidobacteria bacterium]|nr:formate dehydrogenase accessory protein FdhE [Acidobacteriota bacterium]